MGNQFKVESLKFKVLSCSLVILLLLIINKGQSQNVTEETIQIDTITETIKVIYKPSVSTTYYTKKIAVFANDTSQVAIEKSYTNYGQNGLYKVYYPNGRLKIKTVFANNKMNGEWTYYGSEGAIIIKGIYKNGIKHGYWAYKSVKIYGRYKNGLRNKKWYTIDNNNKKVKSTYKKGILVKGKGFGDERISISSDSTKVIKNTSSEERKGVISKEYEQAISFLSKNIVFKKAFKAHFSKGDLKEIRKLKKYFVKGIFQFVGAPLEMNLGINSFIEESKNEKIVVAKIDSILKSNTELQTQFSKSTVEENNMLFNNSTKRSSTMAVYFSKVHQNLLCIDVVRFNEEVLKSNFENRYHKSEKEQRFQVLLYFNNDGVLKGAEYEKP